MDPDRGGKSEDEGPGEVDSAELDEGEVEGAAPPRDGDDGPAGEGGTSWKHHAIRWTLARTKGGAGRRNAGSSAARGSDVERSMRDEPSGEGKVREMVMVSRGEAGQPRR